MNEKLKPCPFCGSKAKMILHMEFGNAYIQCLNTEECGIRQEWFDSEKEAIEAWNRRVKE